VQGVTWMKTQIGYNINVRIVNFDTHCLDYLGEQ